MDNNKEIKDCLTALFSTIEADNNEKAVKLFGNTVLNLKNSKINFKKVSNFQCFILNKIQNGLKLIINSLEETPSKEKNKVEFIYLNSTFLKTNIEGLIRKKEDMSCSADKSSHIINMYLNYARTGEVAGINVDKDEYWQPNFGDSQQWIDFCDSLYKLYYGHQENFFNAYKILLECDVRKYEHLEHLWYIKFKDGKILEFKKTYDEDIENPLDNEFHDKGEFYILFDKTLKNRNYEKYNCEGFDESFFGACYKIPKSDIEEIYKSTKTILV